MNFTYLHPHYTRVTHVGTHSPIYMYHRSLHSHLPMGLPHPTHRHGCTNIPRYTHVPRHVEHTHTRTIDFHSTDTQGPDTQFTLSYIPQLMSHLYMHDTHMTISPHQHRHILKCAHSFSWLKVGFASAEATLQEALKAARWPTSFLKGQRDVRGLLFVK